MAMPTTQQLATMTAKELKGLIRDEMHDILDKLPLGSFDFILGGFD